MRAMISIDSGDTADANVRPLKLASGSGRISTGGCWYSSPSYSMHAGLERVEEGLGCTP